MLKNRKEMRALRFAIFSLMLALTTMLLLRDIMAPQPYDLVAESDEHGLIERPVSLPLYHPNKPRVDEIHLRFKLDHHIFSSGKYLIRANCLARLYVNDELVYGTRSKNDCAASWQTDLDLTQKLKPGTNTLRATVWTVPHEHVHFHMRPCYTFGFC